MREPSPERPSILPPVEPHSGLAQWRALTRRANAAFHAGESVLAHRLYRHALALAEALATPPLAAHADDRLAVRVVAHHNLADSHEHRGELDAALEHRCRPHQALLDLLADPTLTEAVRLCALRHLGETRRALLDGQARVGACARSRQALGRDPAAAAPGEPGARRH